VSQAQGGHGARIRRLSGKSWHAIPCGDATRPEVQHGKWSSKRRARRPFLEF
jgi:hypothetical protein